jgi:hypothetical protein
MKSKLVLALGLFLFILASHVAAQVSSNFQLVGQNPLFNRGMDAAATIFQNFIYIGNRTDGSNRCGFGDPRRNDPNFGLDSCPHPHPGILILNIQNPANPTVVGEIPAPLNALCTFKDLRDPTGTKTLGPCEAKGVTSRELRVWPSAKLLITMNFRCSSAIHACPPALRKPSDWPKGQPFPTSDQQFPFDIKFFSVTSPTNPQFISHFVPTSKAGLQVKPHEMFLWVDPNEDNRALLFVTTPAITTDPTVPNLMVFDISHVAQGGPVTEIAEGNWNNLYPGTNQANYPLDPNSPDGCGPYDCNLFVHSIGVKPDGSVTYMALEAGHFLILDTSDIARNKIVPGTILSLNGKLITDPTNRPVWLQNPADPTAVPNVFPNGCGRLDSTGTIAKDCPNSHSAVQVPSRHLALTTDEIYGTFTVNEFGCRWGWMRLIDISDARHPFITGEFLLDQNQPSFCGSAADTPVAEQFRSFSTHNPTVLQDLAFIDWHSNGLQAISISNPTNPTQAGFFKPTPIPVVATEDPALSAGPATTVDQLLNPDTTNPDFKTKIVLWSYPIIRNGLIYVIDVRNGLFILRYTGRHSDEVQQISFLEGNSNLGDAVDLDQNQQGQQ